MNSDRNGRDSATGKHPSYHWQQVIIPRTANAGDDEALRKAMDHPAYPLSNAYNPDWIVGNSMGPIPTWLAEELAPAMQFESGQRVLDLGCGTALTSIFMAREYGVHVTAADLWIAPDDNAARIAEAGCEGLVTPVRAEAHTLPFAHGWFDAIVSIDAYHYFGTDVRYLSYLAQFVKPGGLIGIVVPANAMDPDRDDAIAPPEKIAQSFGADWFTFRSADWWRRHWSRTLCVDVEVAEMVKGGHATWLRQCDAVEVYCPEAAEFLGDRTLLECEAGRSFGFCKVVARRNDKHSLHFGPGEFETRIA